MGVGSRDGEGAGAAVEVIEVEIAQFVDTEGVDCDQGDGELVAGMVEGVEQAAEPVGGQWSGKVACVVAHEAAGGVGEDSLLAFESAEQRSQRGV